MSALHAYHVPCRNDLAIAQSQIGELAARIKEIQAKAEASEGLVQEICRDIKKLDYAKKHLTNAITALRRLAMLTGAVAGAWAGVRTLSQASLHRTVS